MNALGDVCIRFFMEKFGNIKTDKIIKLWRSEKATNILKKIGDFRRNYEFVVNCYYGNE